MGVPAPITVSTEQNSAETGLVPTMFVARYMSAPNALNYINDQTAIKVTNVQVSPQE
jgi:hypothetical protein